MTNDGLGEIALLTGQGLGGTQFDEMALGSDATNFAATDTALGAEHTTNGGGRKTGADVTGTLETTNFTDDTQQYVASWSFSGKLDINEFGVLNGGTPDILLLRQVFDSVLKVVNGDTLELTVTVVVTTPDNDTDATLPEQLVSQDGVQAGNELIVTDVADPTDGRFDAIGTGNDNGTVLAAADSNSRLGEEFIASGLSRASATVSQVTTNVAGANSGGDTTRFEATFNVTATEAINEIGVFNNTTAPTDDGDADNFTENVSGVLMLRHIFANPMNVVNTDTVTFQIDLVNT